MYKTKCNINTYHNFHYSHELMIIMYKLKCLTKQQHPMST